MGALTKADIVERLYEQTDKTREECKQAVENILDVMSRAIAKEQTMLLSGFGKFECYAKKPRKGRNPQTDEALMLDARSVVVFRLSRKFRAELNGDVGKE